MYKLTRSFLQEILEKDGKAMVSVQRQASKSDIQETHDKEDNLIAETIVISGAMEKVLLDALRKLNKTEIDKDVISEIGNKEQEWKLERDRY
ncbi:hypothetical protein KPL37_15115 [Clostridium frigoris]|uniref:Uncharacterized protein n=1 Tax=Clostridium frigoris TaxID=205327 RepID=A0ABS6BWI1_9CLOT|nr:hypothetical protein [Clostridium frigoris]MBU3161055.1 hypothetical protein [Clostridium frigoris]